MTDVNSDENLEFSIALNLESSICGLSLGHIRIPVIMPMMVQNQAIQHLRVHFALYIVEVCSGMRN